MANLITEHMDIWTAAQTQKANGGRGRGKNSNGQNPHGIKKLRELILELAVRGKLVPQDPNDEPASILLKKIAKEKARLIKEGKIKHQKPLPEVNSDEKPFELPGGWKWTMLGNFVYLEMGQSPPSKFYNQKRDGIPFFQGKADFGDLFPTPRYWCTQPNKFAYPGDVLLSVRAPVGPTNISEIDCCIGRGLAALRSLSGVSTKFILTIMRAFQKSLEEKATGTTFVAVSKKDVEALLIAIPPLSEQHRIVAKVNELMALCDQLEQQQTDSKDTHQTLVRTLLASLTNAADQREFAKAWQRIANHFDTLFTTEQSIDQLKQTILQLAVMGKLVLQDPYDEPASVLLEKIAKEKARLIKEGKIKKQKKLPEISEDEKIFELPIGWAWGRFIDYYDVRDGTHDSPKPQTSGFPLVTSKNLYSGKLDLSNVSYISEEDHLKIIQRSKVDKGDILFAMIGTIGNPVIVDTDDEFSIKNVALFKYYVSELSVPSYLKIFLELAAVVLRDKATGGVQSFVSLGKLRSYIMAFPPLAEQHRIVAKVDELMALCDILKARLNDVQIIQVQLADAIVEQAVA